MNILLFVHNVYLFFFLLLDEKKKVPTKQPAKLKLTRLITAEGSIIELLIKKPIVSRNITKTIAVTKAVYNVPAFLFLPAAIPAAKAQAKLSNELE